MLKLVSLTLSGYQALKSEINIGVKGASFRNHTQGSILRKLTSPKVFITHPRSSPTPWSLSQGKRQENQKDGPNLAQPALVSQGVDIQMGPEKLEEKHPPKTSPSPCSGPGLAGILGSKPRVSGSNLKATLAAPWGKWPYNSHRDMQEQTEPRAMASESGCPWQQRCHR